MHTDIWLILSVCGFLAGIANAVAGGGSLLLYPLLLAIGLPPISANASTSAAVFPGLISSALGYRKFIRRIPLPYFLMLVPCVLGGLTGAILLRHTPNSTFEFIVPWFMLLAIFMMSIQHKINRRLHARSVLIFERQHHWLIDVVIGIAIFVLSVYGGYFGAGFGIVMLVFLGFSSLKDISTMNGLKSLAAIFMNFMAVVYFVSNGLVAWQVLPFLVAGDLLGGWFGSTYSNKLPEKVVRRAITTVAIAATAILFYRQYS